MDSKPLTYGIRQAIKDSPLTVYEIAKRTMIPRQNLGRFVQGSRRLSQDSIDLVGITLGLSLVTRAGLGFASVLPDTPEVTPLSAYIREAIRGKAMDPLADKVGLSSSHLYRFMECERGLSEGVLDSVCEHLGLFVEGPPLPTRPVRRGCSRTTQRSRVVYQTPTIRLLDT